MSSEPQNLEGPDLTAGIPMASLAEGVPLRGHVDGAAVIVVRRGDDVYAIGATCSHYGGPLADGLVVDDTVRCPWHHACFSLRTGEALRAPALNPVVSYEVRRHGETVLVGGKRDQPGTVRPRARRENAPASVAIIGAGAAGSSAAEELRHLGFQGEITLIDRDAPRTTGPTCPRIICRGPRPRSGSRCTRAPITSNSGWSCCSVGR